MQRRNIRLMRLLAEAGEMADQLRRLQFARFHAPAGSWEPAINCYGCGDRILVCVDLAGVPREAIDLRVEPTRVHLRGVRTSPEPVAQGGCRRILAMEIENGPFHRVLDLPAPIDPGRVEARQENGLLWITLPLQVPPLTSPPHP